MRRGLCAHCCLTDDLTALLSNTEGNVAPSLQPIFKALTTQKLARSATIWLTTNSEAKQLLRDFATGVAPVTHRSFTDHASPGRVAFLRKLFMEHGLLEKENLDFERFEIWVNTKCKSLSPADGLVVQQFAKWFHLVRLQSLDEIGKLKAGSFLAARQSISVSIAFLQFLRGRGRTGPECLQEDVDLWLASGPTTHSLARTFVRWAVKQKHLQPVSWPYRVAQSTPVLSASHRIEIIRQLVLDGESVDAAIRASALLFLLFGQPLTRVSRMTLDQIEDHDQVFVTFATDRLVVPWPFDQVLREHLENLPNLNTSTHRENRWLFPGRTPGQHMHQVTIMNRLRDRGVDLRGARNSTLRALVLEMPAPIVADSLGFSYIVADRHRHAAGAAHVNYVSHRADVDHDSQPTQDDERAPNRDLGRSTPP